MTVSTLRPNATVANTSVTVTGASAHVALSDDSDASFVVLDATTDSLTVGFGDFTLPAGAVIKSIGVRVRDKYSANIVNYQLAFQAPVGTFPATASTSSPTTHSLTESAVTDLVEADIDAIEAAITADAAPVFRVLTLYEVYLDVRYVALPVVNVTDPSGTLTETNVPVIEWEDTLDSDGGAQTRYEVKIFTDAVYGGGGFDPDTSTAIDESGVLSGVALSWQTDTLPDDIYRAYVRVAQTVNGELHWSDWDLSGFEIDGLLPADPDLALTAEPGLGRIRIDIEDNAGAVSTDNLEVQRSIDGGSIWTPVRTEDSDTGLILAADATVYDYEAPNGTETTYRARALHNYTDTSAASAWVTAATTWTSGDWWIKHPNQPDLNLRLTGAMFSYPGNERAARHGVFQPLGAELPIVVSDTRGGATGSIVVQLATVAEQVALDALLDTVGTLLLQGPVAHGHPDRYVRFGDHSSVRVIDKGWSHIARETLAWVQVASPPGAQE